MRTYPLVEVVRVVDGDTVDLKLDLGFRLTTTQRFRLLGIDTPERGEVDGHTATRFVEEWLSAAPADLTVHTYKTDKYGRWLAEVERASGALLTQELLAAGLAETYR